MNTRLHIEELILEGFPPGDRYRIAAAVEAELARVFAEQGIPPGLASRGGSPSLDGGSFNVADHARPEQIGAKIAQALHGGMSQ